MSSVGAEIATGARAGSSWARSSAHSPEKKAELIRTKIAYLKTREWKTEMGCREFQMLHKSSTAQEPSAMSRFLDLWSNSAKAKTAAVVSSSDLSFTAPSMLIQQKIGKSPVAAAQVACTSTHNPAHPALLAAQAKDAALLSKVADDFLRTVGPNWEIEFTNIRYAESLPAGKPFVLDTDYLASLSLARGASFSH